MKLRSTFFFILFCSVIFAQTPNLDWGFNNDVFRPYLNNTDIDGKGDIYCAAAFSGTFDVDPGPAVYSLTSSGPSNGFIIKYSAEGNLLWAKAYGGTGNLSFSQIATDSAGNMYVAGTFSLFADLDPGPGQYSITCNSFSSFIAKLSPQGLPVWSYIAEQVNAPIGTVDRNRFKSISVDKQGNVSAVGEINALTDFDPSPATQTLTSLGSWDIFILRLKSNGIFSWARSIGTPTIETAEAVLAADNGCTYLTGSIRSVIDIDPNPSTYTVNSNGVHMFAICLDSLANFNWGTMLDGISTFAFDITGLANGNILFAGSFTGNSDFDPGPSTYTLSSASGNAYVWELTSFGAFVKASSFNTTQGQSTAFSVDVDKTGNIYTSGLVMGIADFDPGSGTYTLAPNNLVDYQSFICKLTPSGSLVWAGIMDCDKMSYAYTIKVDRLGNRVFSAGRYSGTIDLDPGVSTFSLTSLYPNYPLSSGYFHSFCQFAPEIPSSFNGRNILCQGESTTLSIAPSLGAMSYTWLVPPCISGASDSTKILLNASTLCSGQVTVQVANSCGVSSQKFNIDVSECVSIAENHIGESIYVYPNPSSGEIHISCGESAPYHVKIFDVHGSLLNDYKIEKSDVDPIIYVDQPGLYFCSIRSDGFYKTLKFVVE